MNVLPFSGVGEMASVLVTVSDTKIVIIISQMDQAVQYNIHTTFSEKTKLLCKDKAD